MHTCARAIACGLIVAVVVMTGLRFVIVSLTPDYSDPAPTTPATRIFLLWLTIHLPALLAGAIAGHLTLKRGRAP